MALRLHESEAVTALSAGATVFAASRFGLLAMIPAAGPLGAPLVTIAIGVAIAVLWDGEGSLGDVTEGIGYGLIAAGVLELGSKA